MSEEMFRIVVAVAVGLACIAFLVQAGIAVAIYTATRKAEKSVERLLGRLEPVLLKVEQVGGAACHEGYRSCFFRQVTPGGLKVVAARVFDPKDVYKHSE